jgi:hypothetical protein
MASEPAGRAISASSGAAVRLRRYVVPLLGRTTKRIDRRNLRVRTDSAERPRPDLTSPHPLHVTNAIRRAGNWHYAEDAGCGAARRRTGRAGFNRNARLLCIGSRIPTRGLWAQLLLVADLIAEPARGGGHPRGASTR